MATIPMQAEAVLPDFCRRQWASSEARALWEPRIASIGQQFAAAERASVESGVRAACLQSVSPEQLPELARRAAERGLVVVPLGSQGRPESYAASAVPRTSGPWEYRVALTMPGAAGEFSRAWHASDDERQGELLGYPTCCRQFFAETWGAGSVDPTWSMRDHGEGPVSANILLRWLGVRYVPHMPCGFRCEGSLELGRRLRGLVPARERAWMDELLDMPMLWSSIYGIGEVVTPIVTVQFRSDPSHELREIRRQGSSSSYPEASAHGLKFPYRPPPARRPDERLWTDNGFSSLEAMERAHATVAAVAPGEHPRWVLDLGCGNGVLARKLAGSQGHAIGIDSDPGKLERAARYLDEAICGDLHDTAALDYPHDLVLLMPGRLLEQESGLLGQLRDHHLVVYAYGDWLERHGSLENLCHVAGLHGYLLREEIAPGVAAGVWVWQ